MLSFDKFFQILSVRQESTNVNFSAVYYYRTNIELALVRVIHGRQEVRAKFHTERASASLVFELIGLCFSCHF